MAERNSNALSNWVIGLGILGFAALIWWAAGRPGLGDLGQDLHAGEWSCEIPAGQGLGAMAGPGLEVVDGEVASVYYSEYPSGREIPVDYADLEIINPTTLTLTTLYPPRPDFTTGAYEFTGVEGTFECTKD